MRDTSIPNGFSCAHAAAGFYAGKDRSDMALVLSDVPCSAAAVYTTNQVKAACLHVTKEHIGKGKAQAIIINAGNANACCQHAAENALRQAELCAGKAGLDPEQVLVASTGVIGQDLDMSLFEKGLGSMVTGQDWEAARKAILTTDTVEKTAACTVDLDGTEVHLYGFAKGSGMIHPNMGTMLAFILTDAAIPQEALQQMLLEHVKTTFNRVVVDGDTSTNDMCIVLANGLAQNAVTDQTRQTFSDALQAVMRSLAVQIASDGEGASRLITVSVQHAKDEEQAEILARSVVSSSLVKTAMTGADANWGRILCAMGYSRAVFDPDKTDISFSSDAGTILVCRNGKGLPFDEEQASRILHQPAVTILCDLHEGDAEAVCWGCDLTSEYVRINGEYRS